jgi:hypothetical protein
MHTFSQKGECVNLKRARYQKVRARLMKSDVRQIAVA